MTDQNSHKEASEGGNAKEGIDSLCEETADAISEIMADSQLQFETDEANHIARELVTKFTSPLMIQRAAGATSQVSITASPAGGVEGGRSVKARNLLVNLKTTAFALPSTLPALLAVYERNGTPDHVRLAMAAVIALYGWLTVLSKAIKVDLSQRTAGVLRVMWISKTADSDLISQDGLLDEVNSRFKEYRWDSISGNELFSHLESLEKIGCD
jgi:hypothetical protein